jgi:hypothetical protein
LKLSTRRLGVLGAGAALVLGAALTGPAATAGTTTPSSPSTSSRTQAALSRSDALAARFGVEKSSARLAVDRAVAKTECGATDLDAYVDGLINGFSDAEFNFLLGHLEMLDIPTYDALLHGTTTDPRYALRGDYAQTITKTFRDVKRFWDIQSGDIQLMSMHGSVLTDPARVARDLTEVFDYTPQEAAAYAQEVAAAIKKGWFDGGNNPFFTLNAFAFSAEGDPDPLVQGVPDKLIFGDGIIDALNAMGLGDVGPRAVLGHEFGHHVQFEDGLFDSPLTGAEATRRTELMADAFGTYFATHARGLALNTKRVLLVEKSFYDVGDCYFTDPGHHGTPLQRERSSAWAAGIADAARPQGAILPSLTFANMFEKKLPELVAPTA